MPIYEYQCDACSHVHEVIQKMSDPAPTSCPQCGKGPIHKLISATSFVLKGEGWYVTDYKKSPKADPKPTDSKPTAAKSETATTETKTAESKPPVPTSPDK